MDVQQSFESRRVKVRTGKKAVRAAERQKIKTMYDDTAEEGEQLAHRLAIVDEANKHFNQVNKEFLDFCKERGVTGIVERGGSVLEFDTTDNESPPAKIKLVYPDGGRSREGRDGDIIGFDHEALVDGPQFQSIVKFTFYSLDPDSLDLVRTKHSAKYTANPKSKRSQVKERAASENPRVLTVTSVYTFLVSWDPDARLTVRKLPYRRGGGHMEPVHTGDAVKAARAAERKRVQRK